MDNQHVAMWRRRISTLRQTRKLISCPSPTAKTRLQSFSRTQSRDVTGLLTGYKTLRRHLYLGGWSTVPYERGEGQRRKISSHVLWSLGDTHTCIFGSFFLDPKGVRSLFWGQSGTSVQEQGSHDLASDCGAQGARLKVWVYRDRKGSDPITILFYSILFCSKKLYKFINFAYII